MNLNNLLAEICSGQRLSFGFLLSSRKQDPVASPRSSRVAETSSSSFALFHFKSACGHLSQKRDFCVFGGRTLLRRFVVDDPYTHRECAISRNFVLSRASTRFVLAFRGFLLRISYGDGTPQATLLLQKPPISVRPPINASVRKRQMVYQYMIAIMPLNCLRSSLRFMTSYSLRNTTSAHFSPPLLLGLQYHLPGFTPHP